MSGFAAEATVLAWSTLAFDLSLESLLLVGGALALGLSMVHVVRPGWFGLAVAWVFLVVASQWYFARYVAEALALSLALALATLIIAIVSPGYHAIRKTLRRTEEN